MIYKKIDLYEYFNKTKKTGQKGILSIYLHENDEDKNLNRLRPAILILPGGAYERCSKRESEPVALYYLAKSFNAFVLEYSCAPDAFYPTQLLEASMAMAYIKKNAKEFNVLSDKVAVLGFSAGGHLAGTLSTTYNDSLVKDYINEVASFCRPDATILCYPVVLSGEYSHALSIQNVSGENRELKDYLSIDKRVNKNCPPAFIWATQNDNSVPCENAILMALAYKRAGVPFELHVFEDGKHGLSLCNEETAGDKSLEFVNSDVEKWLKLCDNFLRRHGFCLPKFYN